MSALKTYIVEDSAVIRESLIAALEDMLPDVKVVGYAEDERTAVRWLTGDGFGPAPGGDCALVIIDLFLKRGSGQGVLRAARQAHHPAALVVLSNYTTPDMRKRCLALGAHRVFDKSNEIEALIDYCGGLRAGAPHG